MMLNNPHLHDKNIRLGGIDYSLSDIASVNIDIETRKSIIDHAELTYELFEYLLNIEPKVEDELIIYLVKKVGHGDSVFKIPLRGANCRIETPLELAIYKEWSDEVVLSLAKHSESQNDKGVLRTIIGWFFPYKVLDTLEEGANNYVRVETLKDKVNTRMTEHTEPILSMIVEQNNNKRQ